MRSYTVKEGSIHSFWINLHELDAEYQLDEKGNVNKLTIYLKRELPEITDPMRRSIRKGGMIQLQKNGNKNARNLLAVSRLSNEVQIAMPASI